MEKVAFGRLQEGAMPSVEYLLFSIMMLMFLGAVIAFSYFVVRPLRIHWAITEAKKMVVNRNISKSWRFRNVWRTLATARNDLEAAELWRQLKDIREINENWAE
jgi:hypothetical protein